jgi:predicted Zn finger-like uncharacterized protein
MFITCQQCSTMFRLDENRLKPQGSKVRCSQCGNLFIAMPPAIEPLASTPAESFGAPPEPPPMSEAAEDRELEGIDLAELDSILEKDRAAGAADNTGLDAEEETVEFNEADLDFDFESALEADEAPVTEDAADKPAPVADDLDDLDLDMDFDLDVDGLDAGGRGLKTRQLHRAYQVIPPVVGRMHSLKRLMPLILMTLGTAISPKMSSLHWTTSKRPFP